MLNPETNVTGLWKSSNSRTLESSLFLREHVRFLCCIGCWEAAGPTSGT